jgi:hypothetical protein
VEAEEERSDGSAEAWGFLMFLHVRGFVGGVNVYAADSMRTRPVQLYTTPSPLGESHKNPFAGKAPKLTVAVKAV